jgi:hypothetical protein
LSDDLPRRIGIIEAEVGGVKTEIAVLNTKMDSTHQLLHKMSLGQEVQTEILSKFLVLEVKHNDSVQELTNLKKDYQVNKEATSLIINRVWGIVMAGMVFVSCIVGMGMYIYNDKVKELDRHESAIIELQKK